MKMSLPSLHPLRLLGLSLVLLLQSQVGTAATLYVSHGGTANQSLGSLTVDNGDVIRIDSLTGTATRVFDDDGFFDTSENVDAVHLLSNGNLLVSTTSNAKSGNGQHSFNHGDLIEVDISGSTAEFVSVFLSSSDLYAGSVENINAFSHDPAGSLFASVNSGPATANSLSFDDGDITRFEISNPAGTASLYFDDDITFASSANVDALSVLSANSIAISTLAAESIAGISIDRGDIVELTHDGTDWALSATLFDGSGALGFGTNVNLDAVHVVVPEPGTGALLALGLVTLASRRRVN